MSHSYRFMKNKKQKQPKVHFEQYLLSAQDPYDQNFQYLPSDLDGELMETNFAMRRRFRHIAQKLRSRY